MHSSNLSQRQFQQTGKRFGLMPTGNLFNATVLIPGFIVHWAARCFFRKYASGIQCFYSHFSSGVIGSVFVTTPVPMVLPTSRRVNRCPTSKIMGFRSIRLRVASSPGITNSWEKRWQLWNSEWIQSKLEDPEHFKAACSPMPPNCHLTTFLKAWYCFIPKRAILLIFYFLNSCSISEQVPPREQNLVLRPSKFPIHNLGHHGQKPSKRAQRQQLGAKGMG